MLNLPIYLLGSSYYLHTRIDGKQVKKSLRTAYKRVAIIRAVEILSSLIVHKKDLPQKYELDVSRGIMRADDTADHARLMQAIEALKVLHAGPQQVQAPSAPRTPTDDPTALKLCELLEKFFLLRKVTQATALSYKNSVEEFSKFLKNPPITRITTSDVTRWQEHLAEEKKNVHRTIDSKIGVIRAIFNFAKKQGYTRNENPAENRNLLTKKQRQKGGYAIFEKEELSSLFESQFFKEQQVKAPDYTNVVLFGIFTGCRIGEITTLKKDQFKTSVKGTPYFVIRDSKTLAGIREVPLHPFLLSLMSEFLKNKTDKIFKYKEKEGKGAGNAVGKIFARNLDSANIEREKLVFHSLRKYVNNELMRNGASLEHRCQFVGHELDNVNVSVYTNTINIDELAATIIPALDSIAELVKNALDPMSGINLSELIDGITLI
jgi:site-specific recombinase XerD